MNYELHIVRKSVKNLRIKVLDSGTVQAIVPQRMPLGQVKDFVKQKQSWIHKQLQKYEDTQWAFDLLPWQILLHGEWYTTLQRSGQGNRYTIDSRRKMIRRWHDMSRPANQLHRYKIYAKKILPERLAELAKKYGIGYNRCTIRSQKTKRWSCTAKGSINLNWKLIKMPRRVMDYVILHELAHIKHLNHSQDFRDHCNELCPRTDEARAWLRSYGKVL